MPRIKLTLQYKGTNYCGWQVQPNGPTIQAVLQKCLKKMASEKIIVIGSGRTDSGVHAMAQVCHFDWPKQKRMTSSKALGKLMLGINSQLPPDISVISCERAADSFHAQLSAKKKNYEYFIYNSPIKSPFNDPYVWRVPYRLNLKKMKKAAAFLKGEHDFKSFCAADSQAKTTVRYVYKLGVNVLNKYPSRFRFIEAGSKKQEARSICISIVGNGFLKQMVRNIVGTIVDVGRGRTTLTEFKKILKAKDRRRAGMTAPAKGLFLKKVDYSHNGKMP